MKHTTKLGFTLLVISTLAWSILLVADAIPALRGPLEWRWPFKVVADPGRIAVAGVVFVVYLGVALGLLRQALNHPSSKSWTALVVAWALVGTPLIQVAVIYLRHPNVLRELFERTVSLHSGGYYSAIAEVEDINVYLRQFPDLMPNFTIHPKRHPPGIPLVFWWARQLLTLTPGLARRIALPLRGFQCDNLWLQYLSDPQIASTWASIALPGLAGLTVLPLYRLGRYLLDRGRTLLGVLVYPLVLSVGLFATMWDQLIPLFTTLALLWLVRGLRERRLTLVLAAGLAVSVGTFFNLGVVIALAILGLYGLFWHLAHRPLDPRRIALEGAAFTLGLAGVWLIYWLFWGVSVVEVWRVAMSFHLAVQRSFWLWVFYHLYDFLVFLGIPLAYLWGVGTGRALRRRSGQPIHLLALAFVLGLLVIDLSGSSRGEVARVWMFLIPWALVVGLWALPESGRRVAFSWQGALVALLLGGQLFAAGASLRVIHTRYKNRPRSTPTVGALPDQAQATSARFESGITLLGYQVETAVDAAPALSVTLYWQTDRRIGWPWTVFRHVMVDGQLLGQRDSHPAQDAWPTTCWVPGQIVSDHQLIPLQGRLSPGTMLKVGLYDAETGRRLPVAGEGVSPGGDTVEIPLAFQESVNLER